MLRKLVAGFIVAACILGAGQAVAAVGTAARCSQADVPAAPGAAARDEDATPGGVAITPSPHDSGEAPVTPGEMAAGGRYLSSREFLLALLVTAVLLVTLSLQFFLLRKTERLKVEDTLRSFSLTLVIMGTVFFVVAGFDSEQIAPALGLFCTIAGYILGRSERRGDGRND